MSQRPLLSIVVPVFDEAEVIGAFYQRITQVLEALPGFEHELLFVDDGSSDATPERLAALADGDPRVGVVRFSRNFGHQIAITAGIDRARGDAVVVIDADLQDPPELIPRLVEKWREGFDVVYGVRQPRESEGRAKRLCAAAFYRVLRAVTRIEIPLDAGDFRLMSARAASHLRELREKDRFVRGLVSWLGFRQAGVPYARASRHAGETKYPYGKMLKFAIDGITSFSSAPLKLASWLGYLASLLAFVYLVHVVVQKLTGTTVQGWAAIMVAMLFLGGVQLICLGIIGEYIGRIFNEIKPRPMYVVESFQPPAAATVERGEEPRPTRRTGSSAARRRSRSRA